MYVCMLYVCVHVVCILFPNFSLNSASVGNYTQNIYSRCLKISQLIHNIIDYDYTKLLLKSCLRDSRKGSGDFVNNKISGAI